MKFLEIFKTTLKQYSVYRINFLFWRFRVVINILIVYYLWSSLLGSKTNIFGYSLSMMLTYILLSGIASSFALSSRTADIAGEIIRGNIINNILKPISFFKYQATRDLADKSISLVFSIMEIFLLILILKPQLFFQSNIFYIILFLIFLTIGCLISFFINMSLSFIGFWSVEVWAPRFIFYIIIQFFSGTFFPIDILPKPLYYLLMLTPFPYLYYLPTRIYLGFDFKLIMLFCIISIFWLYLSYLMARRFWFLGLKSFSFYGR